MKNTSTNFFLLGLTASSLLVGTASAQAASMILIDDFTDDQFVEFPTNPLAPTPELSQVDGERILGGFRDLEIDGDGMFPINSESVVVSTSGGILFFNNDNGVTGTLTITYDGDDDPASVNETGLGGIDFTTMGLEQFSLSFLDADLPGTDVTLTVFSGAGSASVTETTSEPGILNFAFSDFVGADLTDVGAIQLTVLGPDSLDLAIDQFSATSVPEPTASILLLGTAVTGSLTLRRKVR